MKTQARSKAEKLRQRRGRPRIEGAIREPNGRISRSKISSDPHPIRVALEARARHTGLSLVTACDPRAATYIGRLYMLGRSDGLSMEQYEAAQRFLEIYNDYRKAVMSPAAHYENAARNADMEAYTRFCRDAAKAYNAAMKAIQETQFDNGHENLYAALQYVIIQDQELHSLLGSTRLVLNALHRHFSKR